MTETLIQATAATLLRTCLSAGLVACAGFTAAVQAAPLPFTGNDYSGTYDCKGQDDHEGAYTGLVTLALVRSQSSGVHGAYSFKLEVPGYGIYLGQAAAKGLTMGIHFALTDPSTQDFGTGIAEFKRVTLQDKLGKPRKWTFRKYYYEPAFKGGNFGTEDCVQR